MASRPVIREFKREICPYTFKPKLTLVETRHDADGQQLFSFDMLCIDNPEETQLEFRSIVKQLRRTLPVCYPGCPVYMDELKLPPPPVMPEPRILDEDIHPIKGVQKIINMLKKKK
jgi:hypothetical protein